MLPKKMQFGPLGVKLGSLVWLVSYIEISQTVCLPVALLILSASFGEGGVHGVGFVTFEPTM